MLLASYTSGLRGNPGRQVRYLLPSTLEEAVKIAETVDQADEQENRRKPSICRTKNHGPAIQAEGTRGSEVVIALNSNIDGSTGNATQIDPEWVYPFATNLTVTYVTESDTWHKNVPPGGKESRRERKNEPVRGQRPRGTKKQGTKEDQMTMLRETTEGQKYRQ
jgi:hypothetical protein